MKISNLRVREKELVNIINGLVEHSFGWWFRGDESRNLFEYEFFTANRRLNLIARVIPLVTQDYTQIAGKFDSADGSSLQVVRKYASRARRYAQEYESLAKSRPDLFPKPQVSISIVDKIDIVEYS